MSKINTKQLVKRLKKIVGIKTDSEFADNLGIKLETLSSWKKRNAPDFRLLLELSLQLGININWLLTGEGSELTTIQISKCPHCGEPLQINIGQNNE
jgi:transcriptional regulator with XRE-family HTH domain